MSKLHQHELPLATKLAFVDVETTGSAPDRARITEVAIVTVNWPHPLAGPPQVEHWSSLVNPGVAIAPEIRFLTGIDQTMLIDAPAFAEIAPAILSRLQGGVFVAHHARFDYGFIKAEMARAGYEMQSRTLCTVRLSRALHPDQSSHTLDAVILRHGLRCLERHRAMGDAQVLWQLLQRLVIDHGAATVFNAARRLISRPNLPAHLNIKSVEALPAAPGIYFFHGLNEHPLYIGKSVNIRQRIASHFCTDYQSERGLRLASETHRLTWQETPGEFTALLAEIQAIERHQPAHNRALRSQQQAWFIDFDDHSPAPIFKHLTELSSEGISGLTGPFASRSAARQRLITLARNAGWCLTSMGLERTTPNAPCFARQLGRCAGACIGEQSTTELLAVIRADLKPYLTPAWPPARLLVLEQNPQRELLSWHLFEQWHWLQSGDSLTALDASLAEPPTARFDRNIYALLLATLRGRRQSPPVLVAPPEPPSHPDYENPDGWTHGSKKYGQLSWCWLAPALQADPAMTTDSIDSLRPE